MKNYFIILFLLITNAFVFGQNLTGEELLAKAIAYHDPQNNWDTFNAAFNVEMESPKSSKRTTEIKINLPEEYFYSKAIKDTLTTEFTLDKGSCSIVFCGTKDFSEAQVKEYGLNCERASMYKNYYTYLYGLPMKLKDAGTIIHENVERKSFKGKEYLVLKVTYDKTVGGDIWYFYFNPKTFAMEVYQFFHDESKNDGEYILLSEEEIIQGIKMPKIRKWYYNTDDGYLGTDTLK
ncbi:MAG: hypothetical protein KUG68_01780 [Flavobacteriaceae bacterium]|nr:hypothetical protein [Flavobacteriaceae bacterium]